MLLHIQNLGAINKITKQYCCPKLANKQDEYICPECNKSLILKKGILRIHHFSHYKADNPCNYYNNPTETQIHKDAKLAIKQILENSNTQIRIIRKCYCCQSYIHNDIYKNNKKFNIELEYKFIYNNLLKIADIAIIYKNNIIIIFEIYHSHNILNDERPEPWYELNATSILSNKDNIELECIRKEKCKNCIKKHNIEELNIWLKTYGTEWNGDTKVLENIIRKILGQTEYFNENIYKWLILFNKILLKDINYYDLRPYHLRINQHADCDSDYEDNKKIIDIFNSLFIEYTVILHSWKGAIYILIINKEDENNYDYYNDNQYYNNKYPYKCKIDLGCGIGTIDIIIIILKIVYNIIPSFNTNITEIELDIDNYYSS